VVALTFDDGPHATQTPILLDALKKRNVKGTFFVVGKNVAEYPEIARRIVQEGHQIASHSFTHPDLSRMSEASVREEIVKTHRVIEQITGVTVTLFRPPYGAFTARQRNWAAGTWNYKTILWDVDTLDWKTRSTARTKHSILTESRPGSIILTHDIHAPTVAAIPDAVDGLLAQGFKFVTVSELLALEQSAAPVAPEPTSSPLTAEPAPSQAVPSTAPKDPAPRAVPLEPASKAAARL
jgi:peptidoglycan/xylan/chitin deacetylase (PgdA/CDA1 family)